MGLGRFERWMSRCNTADSRRPKCRRIQRRREFRLAESIYVLDRNPIWMTPFFPLLHDATPFYFLVAPKEVDVHAITETAQARECVPTEREATIHQIGLPPYGSRR